MPFSPFVACTILGPHAVNVGNCLPRNVEGTNAADADGPDLDIELLKLCIKRHAWYWPIGTLLLGAFSTTIFHV